MKRLLAVLCLYVLGGSAIADANPLVGSFTHDFTRPKNQSVWTVKKAGLVWQVRVHGAMTPYVPRQSPMRKKQLFGSKCGGLLTKRTMRNVYVSRNSLTD